MECPYKKIITVVTNGSTKTTTTMFGECDPFKCRAAITHCDCSNRQFFDGCQLMIKGEKR
jgi:hypothetical protein